MAQPGGSNDNITSVSQTQSVSAERQLPPVVTTTSQFVQQQQQQQQDEPRPVVRSISIDRPPRTHLAPFSFPPVSIHLIYRYICSHTNCRHLRYFKFEHQCFTVRLLKQWPPKHYYPSQLRI